MKTIIVTIGIPGSGKSTWAKQVIHENACFKRLNRDDIRMMIDDGFDAKSDVIVNELQERILKHVILTNDVIIDNTHLNKKTINRYHKIAQELGDITIVETCFPTPPNECLRRNALRQGVQRVPDNVMASMIKAAYNTNGTFKFSDKTTKYDAVVPVVQDTSLQKAIICDLDGTLALMNGRNPYDATHCDNDLPNKPVIECVKALASKGYKLIFMSGREAKYCEPTVRFIEEKLRPQTLYTSTDYIPYELFMRQTGDMRSDVIIKRELFMNNVFGRVYVEFCLDDRNTVVNGWRNLGLTVFQVAPGDF